MKKIILFLTFLLLLGCKTVSPLAGVNTDGLRFSDGFIYYNNDIAAEMTTMEVALDNNEIVTEITFKLTDENFNHLAINIIKFVHDIKPEWEIEVELKNIR